MKSVVFIILFIPFVAIYAQNTKPGGVQGACVWEITESTQGGQARWKSNIKNTLDTGLVLTGKIRSINHNPALYFNQNTSTLNSTLNLGELKNYSLFTVCQENDTIAENVIFSLENDTAAEMVLTNERMAILDVYRYVNYNANRKLWPKIYSYTQNKSEDQENVNRRLSFGRPPKSQHLPVQAYNGIMPEVILFNRFISPLERQKVESYLALKYGISLRQLFPLSYLNSNGKRIWDAELNADFSNNIAGIGRDDLSGLNQRISESTQTPGVMKIELEGELRNNSFLIWGDNDRPLRFIEESGIRKLQREWKISTFNFENDPVLFETNDLSISEIDPLKEDEVYWMMIDKSGTGKYPFRQTKYVQCEPMPSSRGFIRFNSIVIDDDNSGNDVFTLLIAPLLFSKSAVVRPTCFSPKSGVIQTEIAGGLPPYKLVLKGTSNTLFQISEKIDTEYHIFENISQGGYELQIIDSENNIYTEKIWVPNTHLWESSLEHNYKLTEGETLILDASIGMPAVNYIYSWTNPDGSIINHEEIEIDQPGTYLLSITDDNNCNSTSEINIKQISKSNIKKVELLPNPTSSWFMLRVSLERRADVMITISDMMGTIIKQSVLRNDLYYLYDDTIQQDGMYLITLVSGEEKKTLKLIVQ